MSSAKESVELLTTILHSFGYSKITPEEFRKAKYNDPEVLNNFWRLLFEILYHIKFGALDEVCVKAYHLFSPDEIKVYVRYSMNELGFFSSQFLKCNSEKETEIGSRELLLAFGWLLCREGLMHKLHLQCLSPLKDTSANQSNQLYNINSTNNSTNSKEEDNFTNSFNGLKQMIWLNGKLRMNLKRLYWLRRQNQNYIFNIHNSTKGVASPSIAVNDALINPGHLTFYDVYLMKNPKLLCQNLLLLDKDNKRLKDLLKWRQYEQDFWLWMESVLDLKLNEDDFNEESEEEISTNHFYYMALKRLSDVHQQLHDSLLKYESIASSIEKEWQERNLTSLHTGDIEQMIKEMNEEIVFLSKNISWVKQQLNLVNPQTYFLLNNENESKKQQTISQNNNDDANFIVDQIMQIQNLLFSTKENLQENKEIFSQKLDSLTKMHSYFALHDPSSSSSTITTTMIHSLQ